MGWSACNGQITVGRAVSPSCFQAGGWGLVAGIFDNFWAGYGTLTALQITYYFATDCTEHGSCKEQRFYSGYDFSEATPYHGSLCIVPSNPCCCLREHQVEAHGGSIRGPVQ